MKKVMIFLLAVLMIALLAACGSDQNADGSDKSKSGAIEFVYGDADGDGKMTILDVTRIQRHLAGLTPQVAEEDMKKAMVADGATLSVLDATLIQRRLVGIIKSFPVEAPGFVPPTETTGAAVQNPSGE